MALETKLIDETQFVEWDREQSGLAVLKLEFFNAPPPLELFKKYNYAKCRAQGYLPVGEWDGNLYWAKFSSDAIELQNQGANNLWFLAPFSGLKTWFAAWAASVKNIETIDIDFESLSHMDGAEIVVAADFIPPSPATALTPIGPASSEAPPPPTSDTEAPMPFANIALDLEPGSETNAGASPATEVQTQTRIPLQTVTQYKTEMPLIETPSIKTPSIKNPSGEGPFMIKPMKVTTEEDEPLLPPVPPEEAIKGPTIPKPLIPQEPFEAQLSQAATEDELAEVAIRQWQSYFEQVMILIFRGEKLAVWKHDRNWKSVFAPDFSIGYDTPSIFKIVVDTARPYHGYVAPSAINDHFFKSVNNAEYPEHVTVIPVTIGERVIAMLVGTASKSLGHSLILEKLESEGRQLAVALQKLKPQKKAS
ncbi:unnamed protein product [Sphagnum balticum]